VFGDGFEVRTMSFFFCFHGSAHGGRLSDVGLLRFLRHAFGRCGTASHRLGVEFCLTFLWRGFLSSMLFTRRLIGQRDKNLQTEKNRE
jgi:hypothetical protein